MPLSHVVFRSGFVQDVAAIVRRAHEVGRPAWWPTCTSPRARCRWTSTAWDVDFATGGSREVAVRRAGRRLPVRGARACRSACSRGSRAGWRTSDPFAFEPGRDRLRATDATRFLHGTPAVPALYAARAGYEIVDAARRRRHPRASRCGRCSCSMDLAREPRPRAAHAPTSPTRAGAWPSSTCPTARRSRASCCAARSSWTTGPGAGIRYLPALLHDRRRDPPRHRRDARDPRLRRVSGPRAARARRAFEPHPAWRPSHTRGLPTPGRGAVPGHKSL